jgi:hypothetical protein
VCVCIVFTNTFEKVHLASTACVCVRVCVYIYMYMYVYIYIYVYVCMYMYTVKNTCEQVHLASTAGPGDNPAKISQKKISALVYLLRKATM